MDPRRKPQLEDFEYSPKAAQDSQERTRPTVEQMQAIAQRNQQHGQQRARELSEQQQALRKPIEDEATLAKALLKLQAATGVKVGIERPRRKKGKK